MILSVFLRGLLGLALLLGVSCADPSPLGDGGSNPPPPVDPTDQKVILVIIDGLRYSEGLGDPERAWIPRMNALASQGAIVEPFLNNGVTLTWRAIPAIWSGSWALPTVVSSSCGETNQATAPTIFEYYRKALDRPEDDCVYVLGDVGCPWLPSAVAGYGEPYWPEYAGNGHSDLENWGAAREILETQQPGFMLLYLSDVDHAGHDGDWNAYTQAIRTADSIVGMLWDTLQSDPEYAGKTTLVVTNDHGRHNNRPGSDHDGFSGHGDSCSGCRTIQLLLVGPRVRTGWVSTTQRTIPDIAPTIGVLLGFPTEQATGQPMLELLIDP